MKNYTDEEMENVTLCSSCGCEDIVEEEKDENSGNQNGENKEEEKLDKEEEMKLFLSKKDQKIKELEAQVVRLSADFTNLKKRSEKERIDALLFSNEELIKSLLPAIDDGERALNHIEKLESEHKDIHAGVQLVFKKLFDILKSKGLEEIDALGKPFDPNQHHAVSMEENKEYPKDYVCEVLAKGYLLNGKVIRPAMVKVSE